MSPICIKTWPQVWTLTATEPKSEKGTHFKKFKEQRHLSKKTDLRATRSMPTCFLTWWSTDTDHGWILILFCLKVQRQGPTGSSDLLEICYGYATLGNVTLSNYLKIDWGPWEGIGIHFRSESSKWRLKVCSNKRIRCFSLQMNRVFLVAKMHPADPASQMSCLIYPAFDTLHSKLLGTAHLI